MSAGRPLADWRSAEPYANLAACDRYAFAWEWLRRSPQYLAASESIPPGGGAAMFGLHRFEPAGDRVPVARPIWRADVDGHVVVASAMLADGHPEAIDFAHLGHLAKCVVGLNGAEHWLWSDGIRHVRLDVIQGTLRDGPVQLEYRIAGFRSVLPRLITIHRLVALARTGRLAPRLFPPARRAPRWAMILRTHDALTAGASHRDIAEHLFGLNNLARWRIEAPSVRRQVQRLVFAARAAARIEPFRWLDET